MWAGKLRMRIILYKALKAKISIIWKIPNLRLFPTVYNALGDPKLYSRSSRHYSSSEDDFQFSWRGAAKREFQSCLLPKSLFGYRNLYSSTSRDYSSSEDNLQFLMGGDCMS